MINVLITGKGSYIGTHFKELLQKYPDKYYVEELDVRDDSWKLFDFSKFDTIYHVAGIAHIKETEDNKQLYYKVNRDLAVEIAKNAKKQGVRKFIFMSSMSVYGLNVGVINRDTKPKPTTNYGKSKYEAEIELTKMVSDNFKVCIIRPPMVYGRGCKGNFQSLMKIVKSSPVFPRVMNNRSMISIDNLSMFIKKIIDEDLNQTLFPQNKEYVSTMEIVKCIAEKTNKKIYFSYILGAMIYVGRMFIPTLQKAFGNLIYKDTEVFNYDYCITSNVESIKNSVE